jgi:hypothetical protein
MPGTLPHPQDGFAPAAPAEQDARKDAAQEAADEDPTTLKFDGKVAISDEDAGSDPYNRSGRFRRIVR